MSKKNLISDTCFARFWADFGASWGLWCASWAPLGASWAPLGRSWDALGALLDALGRSWSALGRSWAPILAIMALFCLQFSYFKRLSAARRPRARARVRRPRTLQEISKRLSAARRPRARARVRRPLATLWQRSGRALTLERLSYTLPRALKLLSLKRASRSFAKTGVS